jgi:multiple sugar transport system ATP-binding protein
VEAMTLGDRIVVMHEGRVRQVDTPANVYDRPHDTFVAGFLGSPPMNLLPATLAQHDGRWEAAVSGAPAVRFPLSPALASAAAGSRVASVVVGVRPEHLTASNEPNRSAGGFAATLELAEPLGHEQLLHLSTGTARITVRGAPGARPAIGSVMSVSASPERLHLFDPMSGVSLSARG